MKDAFLIPINAIYKTQILAIHNVINEKWTFTIAEKCVYGYTFYEDNGFMHDFIISLGLNKKYIYWAEPGDGVDLDLVNREIIQHQRKEKLEKLKI